MCCFSPLFLISSRVSSASAVFGCLRVPTIASHVANSRILFSPSPSMSSPTYNIPSLHNFLLPPSHFIFIIYTSLPAPFYLSCLRHPPAVEDLHISKSYFNNSLRFSWVKYAQNIFACPRAPVCKNPSVHLLSTFFTTFSEPVTLRSGLLADACVLCQQW